MDRHPAGGRCIDSRELGGHRPYHTGAGQPAHAGHLDPPIDVSGEGTDEAPVLPSVGQPERRDGVVVGRRRRAIPPVDVDGQMHRCAHEQAHLTGGSDGDVHLVRHRRVGHHVRRARPRAWRVARPGGHETRCGGIEGVDGHRGSRRVGRSAPEPSGVHPHHLTRLEAPTGRPRVEAPLGDHRFVARPRRRGERTVHVDHDLRGGVAEDTEASVGTEGHDGRATHDPTHLRLHRGGERPGDGARVDRDVSLRDRVDGHHVHRHRRRPGRNLRSDLQGAAAGQRLGRGRIAARAVARVDEPDGHDRFESRRLRRCVRERDPERGFGATGAAIVPRTRSGDREPVRLQADGAAEGIARHRHRSGRAVDGHREHPATPVALSRPGRDRDPGERSDRRPSPGDHRGRHRCTPDVMGIARCGIAPVLDRRKRKRAAGGPSARRRREHRQCDRTRGGADATHDPRRGGDRSVDRRLFRSGVRPGEAGPPRGAGIELADQITGLGVRVPVLGQAEAPGRDRLRLQRRRSAGRPRGRHLGGDDHSQVLLERHLVDGPVLPVGAIGSTECAAIGPDPTGRFTHGGEVGHIGAR